MLCNRVGRNNGGDAMAEGSADKYRAPALDKGLDILELLAASPVGLTQADIAKGLGRGANEIYRMLDTLVRRSYVVRAEDDKYMLSLRLLVLANMHPPRRRLLDIADPPMRHAAQEAEQSVHLALWEDGDIVIASSFSAPGNWRLSLRPGSQIGLYNTGSGLVLAAFQDENMRGRMLREHTLVGGEELMPEPAFLKILQETREQGHACEPSRHTVGVVNISFPILDPFGHAVAALTCPYLERIDAYAAPPLETVTGIMGETAARISQQLNGTLPEAPE